MWDHETKSQQTFLDHLPELFRSTLHSETKNGNFISSILLKVLIRWKNKCLSFKFSISVSDVFWLFYSFNLGSFNEQVKFLRPFQKTWTLIHPNPYLIKHKLLQFCKCEWVWWLFKVWAGTTVRNRSQIHLFFSLSRSLSQRWEQMTWKKKSFDLHWSQSTSILDCWLLCLAMLLLLSNSMMRCG